MTVLFDNESYYLLILEVDLFDGAQVPPFRTGKKRLSGSTLSLRPEARRERLD